VDPNKDIEQEQKKEDLQSLIEHKEIRESSTSGQPLEQEDSQTKVINPFRND
jgi:hypothetical protein